MEGSSVLWVVPFFVFLSNKKTFKRNVFNWRSAKLLNLDKTSNLCTGCLFIHVLISVDDCFLKFLMQRGEKFEFICADI